MGLTAFCHKILPDLLSFLTGEIVTLKVHILEHIHNRRRHFDLEWGTGCGAHNGKCLTTLGTKNILLLLLVDSARLGIKPAQILHIIRCKTEYKAVLARIDDGRGFSCDLLASNKVLDILGNNNLHTVVLTDTLSKLKHEIKGNRELGVNEYMRLIYNNHNLTLQTIACIVVSVLDDFVVYVLEH